MAMNARDLTKKIIPSNLFYKIEPYGHWIEAIIAQARFGFPTKNMKVIGVTGTDGKTTTAALIAQMLRNSGFKVAVLTTISVDFGDGKGEQPNPTRMTTMGAMSLVGMLKKIKDNNVDWLVLETTSHALAQHRVWGIPYSVAVFTNLGHEHLDYHRTFTRYRDAKRRLFKQANANNKGLKIGLVNADDPSAEYFAGDIALPISYGINNGEMRPENIQSTSSSTTYSVKYRKETYQITCKLPGSFNIYNSLATVGVGIAVGLTKEQIEQGIASLQSVEGRMTRINAGQDFEVIVDYAHTPESFEKMFQEMRPLTKGRLISVFGSAGRRDETKRGEQGRIAGKYCDIVVATEEDDRDEDGAQILTQIATGAVESGKAINQNLFVIHKREDAIAKAFALAQKDDIVLLLGKGHEKSILTNGPEAADHRNELQNDDDPKRVIKREYDEVAVARKLLSRKKNTAL
jgi:UDP-N-acetylmuramoyl-L-alanyl-D-glutamate--2,6-diaminopimelate ligase